MKQTAIEWLVEQIKDYDCSPITNDEEYVIVIPRWILNSKKDEAIEKEKQQIMVAYYEGYSDGVQQLNENDEYYYETY